MNVDTVLEHKDVWGWRERGRERWVGRGRKYSVDCAAERMRPLWKRARVFNSSHVPTHQVDDAIPTTDVSIKRGELTMTCSVAQPPKRTVSIF